MTVPFWCVGIACVLPYLWLPFALWSRFKLADGLDNARPREQARQLSGLGARAMGAHHNGFEALAVFAAAVVVSHLASADPELAQWISIGWVACRLSHGIFYLFNVHPLRSLFWTASYALSLSLFVLPLL